MFRAIGSEIGKAIVKNVAKRNQQQIASIAETTEKKLGIMVKI